MPLKVIQIVTGLPPDVDGVGDYALTLARALRDHAEIESTFVVANPNWRGAASIEGFHTVRLKHRDPVMLHAALAEIMTENGAPAAWPVLLHCSMYGYAARALPFWLVRGIESWRSSVPGCAWITMFHELVSFGPVWTTAFWSHLIQCHLIRRLAGQSDAYVVSNMRYLRELARIADLDPASIQHMPVLSTVGEPAGRQLPPAAARKRQIVIFGRGSTRDAVFHGHLGSLETACHHLQIDRIVEIGPGRTPRHFNHLPAVEALGVLEPSEVSFVLRESLLGFVSLEAERLGKSSVFAALCAHAVTPIVASPSEDDADGLSAGVHYLADARLVPLEDRQLDSVSRAAYRWYAEHDSAIQARRYAAIAFGAPQIQTVARAVSSQAT